jgi:hypothetical protein
MLSVTATYDHTVAKGCDKDELTGLTLILISREEPPWECATSEANLTEGQTWQRVAGSHVNTPAFLSTVMNILPLEEKTSTGINVS